MGGQNSKNCNFFNFLNVYAPENPKNAYTPRQNGSDEN